MITQELLGYIRGELAKGRTRGEINGALLSGGGWTEDDLSEAFRVIVPMQANTIMKEVPSMSPTPNVASPHISIVPPLSSSKPFVSAVINPSSVGAPAVNPVPPSMVSPQTFKPPVINPSPVSAPSSPAPVINPANATPKMSSVFPNTPIIPHVTPTTTPSVPPIIPPATPTITPVTPSPTVSMTPPIASKPPSYIPPVARVMQPVTPPPVASTQPSFTPPVVPPPIQQPVARPSFTPPVVPSTPTFSSSPLKQPVIPNPPPLPPPRTFPWLKMITILVVVAGLGFIGWYFRAELTDMTISVMGKIFK